MTTEHDSTEISKTYEIQMVNASHGWQANSHAALDEVSEGTRVLKLTTSKSNRRIVSRVRVFVQKTDGNFFSETTDMFGDFHKSDIESEPCKRVSKKAILIVHQRALYHMDSLIEEAKEFNLKKDAETEQVLSET